MEIGATALMKAIWGTQYSFYVSSICSLPICEVLVVHQQASHLSSHPILNSARHSRERLNSRELPLICKVDINPPADNQKGASFVLEHKHQHKKQKLNI